jgi:hypothetical protein
MARSEGHGVSPQFRMALKCKCSQVANRRRYRALDFAVIPSLVRRGLLDLVPFVEKSHSMSLLCQPRAPSFVPDSVLRLRCAWFALGSTRAGAPEHTSALASLSARAVLHRATCCT